jgi:hypothetical protein
MAKQPDVQRIQADLEGAQEEIQTASKVDGTLGDSLSYGFTSLLAAVRSLFAGLNDHSGKIDELGRQVKIAQHQIDELQRKVHGLRVSKGKAIAAKERALARAEAALTSTQSALDQMSIH